MNVGELQGSHVVVEAVWTNKNNKNKNKCGGKTGVAALICRLSSGLW